MVLDRHLRSSAAGASLGATLGGLGLGVYDVVAVGPMEGGAGAVVAILAATFLLTTLGALAAFVIVTATRAVLLALERVGIDWSAVSGAIVAASICVLEAQELVLVTLNGNGIRVAVVALSAALGVALGVGVAAGVRVLARRPGLTLSLRARTTSVVVMGVTTFVLVIALAPGLSAELDVEGLASAGIPLGLGLAFALAGIEARLPLRAAVAAWSLLAVSWGAQLATHVPHRVGQLIARNTHASRWAFEMFWPGQHGKLAPFKPGTGTCYPGVESRPISGSPRPAAPGAPDILFITVDAMRWDHTTLGGYQRDTTPGLARWAASAAVFTSAMTPASSTRQTFRSLFSGVYPSQVRPSLGLNPWTVSFPAEQQTLASHLHHAGYRTVAASERSDGFESNTGSLTGFERTIERSPPTGSEGARRATRAREQIDSLLDELRAQRTKPLFGWAHIMVPHQPYLVDSPSAYGSAEVDLYDWSIRFMDAEISRFLQALQDEGRLAHTFVILSADHGQAFREHGGTLHGHTVYSEETHVPLIVWGPGIHAGKRVEPMSTLDLFPTILELADAQPPPTACGTSLVSWLRDPTRRSQREVYIEQVPDQKGYFQIGYVRDLHKLIVRPPTGIRELYDLRTDPHEQHDISEQNPRLTEEMVEALLEFQKRRQMDPASYGLP